MTNEQVKTAIAYLHRYADRREDDMAMAQAARNKVAEFSAKSDIKGINETVEALHTLFTN